MDKVEYDRLIEIRDQMIYLLEEARNILHQHAPKNVNERAKAYWIGHIDVALGGGKYPHTIDYTFQKTLVDLESSVDLPKFVLEKLKPGHTLKYDPPHSLSKTQRYTCSKCDAVVLWASTNVYGSATERACK